MLIDDRLKQSKDLLQAHARKAFVPETEESTKLFNTASKFGGYPYLRDKRDWPICPGCKKHMNLFVQLDLAQIPLKYADNQGLLQVFYCTQADVDATLHCELSSDNFEPFSLGTFLRKINIEGESAEIDLGQDAAYMFEERLIVDWEAIEDFPHPEHYEALGIDIEDEVMDAIYEEEDIAMAGDKLGGWEHFIQFNEKIVDPDDGKEYVYLMQIDSEDNLNYMFGDSGIAFIGYHPDKPEKLAMFWQCC